MALLNLESGSVINQDGSAVVVGGGSGIGAAVADRYRDRGVPVVVWDIAGDRDVTCDIAVPDDIDVALARTMEDHGRRRSCRDVDRPAG
jgi:NAD(P)-dependent dehydrogenase (short-subunit alcohol dehydrogenase family)